MNLFELANSGIEYFTGLMKVRFSSDTPAQVLDNYKAEMESLGIKVQMGKICDVCQAHISESTPKTQGTDFICKACAYVNDICEPCPIMI